MHISAQTEKERKKKSRIDAFINKLSYWLVVLCSENTDDFSGQFGWFLGEREGRKRKRERDEERERGRKREK